MTGLNTNYMFHWLLFYVLELPFKMRLACEQNVNGMGGSIPCWFRNRDDNKVTYTLSSLSDGFLPVLVAYQVSITVTNCVSYRKVNDIMLWILLEKHPFHIPGVIVVPKLSQLSQLINFYCCCPQFWVIEIKSIFTINILIEWKWWYYINTWSDSWDQRYLPLTFASSQLKVINSNILFDIIYDIHQYWSIISSFQTHG